MSAERAQTHDHLCSPVPALDPGAETLLSQKENSLDKALLKPNYSTGEMGREHIILSDTLFPGSLVDASFLPKL